MKIWVDADACPGVIKDVLFRAAKRCEIYCTLVANMSLHTPESDFIDCVVVKAGPDVADAHIAQNTQTGDIVVTADIPLAALLVVLPSISAGNSTLGKILELDCRLAISWTNCGLQEWTPAGHHRSTTKTSSRLPTHWTSFLPNNSGDCLNVVVSEKVT
jgi:hypothetical protein